MNARGREMVCGEIQYMQPPLRTRTSAVGAATCKGAGMLRTQWTIDSHADLFRKKFSKLYLVPSDLVRCGDAKVAKGNETRFIDLPWPWVLGR